MANKDVSIKETLRLSYNLFKNNFTFFVKLLSLIVSLTVILVILNSGFLSNRGQLAINNLFLLLFMFGVFFLRLLLFNGVKRVVLRMYDYTSFRLDDLFFGSEMYYKLTICLLGFMLVAVIYLVSGGTITALISGLIYHFSNSFWLSLLTGILLGVVFIGVAFYLYVRVYFTPYLLVDADFELVSAVKYSFLLTEGVVKELFLLHLSWQVINFLLFTVWNLWAIEIVYAFNRVVGIFLIPTFFIIVFSDIYRQLLEESEVELDSTEKLGLMSLVSKLKPEF